jgi:ATP-dependent exoDNAse (exonuclease V) beta subunit
VEKVESWLAKQIERLSPMKSPEKKIEQVRDIAETLRALAQDSTFVDEITSRIESLFADTDSHSAPVVVLSTIHKAKGLEWPRVWLLAGTFKRGTTEGEEANVWYVAVTRSQCDLFIVDGTKSEAENETKCLAQLADSANTHSAMLGFTMKMPPRPKSRHSTKLIVIEPEKTIEVETESSLIKLEVGMVFDMNEQEHIVTVVEVDSAIIRPVPRGERIRLLSNMTSPSRIKQRVSADEIENFLSRAAMRDEERKTNGKNQKTESNAMAKTKTEKTVKAPKIKGASKANKLGGAADFVRAAYAAGTSKTETFKQVIAKWPAFKHDEIGLQSRWNTAERIAKNAKFKGDVKPAAKTPAKSTAKKAAKVAAPAKKIVKPAKAAPQSVPPPPARPDAEDNDGEVNEESEQD